MNVFNEIIRLQREAERFGFRWENHDQIIRKIQSECLEMNTHLNDVADDPSETKLQEEIGDLLHAVCSLCVFCQFDPQGTLEKAVRKFAFRFKAVKDIAATRALTTLKGCSCDELMSIWEQSKRLVG